MAKIGRPQKPYQPSWPGAEPIPGLLRRPDGRWKILATGHRYTEHDERRAVARFLDWKAKNDPTAERVQVPTTIESSTPDPQAGRIFFRAQTLDKDFWPWLRKLFAEQPAHVAKMLGVPEERVRELPLPRPSIKLSDIVDAYRRENPSTAKSKDEAVAVVDRLVAYTNARTLADLTQDALGRFRAHVEATVPGPATRRAYYGRVRTVISFGLKVGLDAEQIGACLDRCKVLWTAAAMPGMNPKPISRDDFHKLLNAAGRGPWRAWLLVGLNLCLHIEEVCALRWADIDLERGTFACIRNKTRRQRIPRAATLWPETLEALRGVPRRDEHVFISTHGTRFNKNTRINDFKEFRERVGVSATWDSLRDGAYSAACRATVDDKWARLLAGHSAPGLQDSYVLRNPDAVRPACEAVYAAYGPFPAPAA
jgi:integrase